MANSGTLTMDRSRRQRVQWRELSRYVFSYLPDWCLALLFYIVAHRLEDIPGFKRHFSLTDMTIQYPFAMPERVTSHQNQLISELAPALLIPVINLIFVRSLWDLHNAWLGLAFSISLTEMVTNLLKVCVGRPRPDLLDRCQPALEAVSKWGVVDHTICTQADVGLLRDGFRSFPSGHSSLAFAGLGYLALYLMGKLHLWNERGYTSKAWLSLIPVSGAALIAVSRTMDYRHHWHDIVVGSAIGMTFAYFSYRQFFPSLTHPVAHQTFKPRFKRDDIPLDGTDEERQSLYRGPHDEETGDVAATRV